LNRYVLTVFPFMTGMCETIFSRNGA